MVMTLYYSFVLFVFLFAIVVFDCSCYSFLVVLKVSAVAYLFVKASIVALEAVSWLALHLDLWSFVYILVAFRLLSLSSQAGELLYLPAMWYHRVAQKGASWPLGFIG